MRYRINKDKLSFRDYIKSILTLAGAAGFEPATLGFGDRCSDQTELRSYA